MPGPGENGRYDQGIGGGDGGAVALRDFCVVLRVQGVKAARRRSEVDLGVAHVIGLCSVACLRTVHDTTRIQIGWIREKFKINFCTGSRNTGYPNFDPVLITI